MKSRLNTFYLWVPTTGKCRLPKSWAFSAPIARVDGFFIGELRMARNQAFMKFFANGRI
jgi:hypothetical protein